MHSIFRGANFLVFVTADRLLRWHEQHGRQRLNGWDVGAASPLENRLSEGIGGDRGE